MWTGAAFGAGTLTRAARAKPATSKTANRRLVGEIKRGLASAAKTCLWRTWGIQRTAWLRSCARRDRVAAGKSTAVLVRRYAPPGDGPIPRLRRGLPHKWGRADLPPWRGSESITPPRRHAADLPT